MFDRFTDNAKKSLRLASTAAESEGKEHLSPEQLLYGVLSIPECGAVRLLVANKIIVADMLKELSRRMSPPGADMPNVGRFPFTPRAKLVFESALRESRMAGDSRVRTEHLLVAISEFDSPIVAEILHSRGLTTRLLRQTLHTLQS